MKNALTLARGRVPRQLVVQVTDACNATCPQCGMRSTNRFRRSRLDKPDLRKVIRHAAGQDVQAISFTGGEPFLLGDELFELIHLAKVCGIRHVRTGTNGLPFLNPSAPDFRARTELFCDRLSWSGVDNFWISLDSSDPDVHESLRGLPGVIAGIEKTLPVLASRQVHASVNIGLNRLLGGALPEKELCRRAAYDFYRTGLEKLFTRAIDLGFTILNCCYPMSSPDGSFEREASVYQATSAHEMISFSNEELIGLYRALFDLIPVYRKKIRIFTPRCSLYSLLRDREFGTETARGCRGGSDYLFVSSANGHAFPCGYRGDDDLGPFTGLDIGSLPYRDHCRDCEWECFRDPTELFGPFSDVLARPLSLMRHVIDSPDFYRLWLEDLKYARAAGYFSGRTAPDYERMRRHSKSMRSAADLFPRPVFQE